MSTGTERLLAASSAHSYDPDLDIDWDAPLIADRPSLPPHRVSLYGTPLWDGLTPEQRLTLGTHEWGSITRFGIWFEVLLMRMLAGHIYQLDPASDTAQYALTEIGDETRHSVMFAREVDKLGAAGYAPSTKLHRLGDAFAKLAPRGPAMFATTLVVEETLDRLQREMMADESLQPLVRMTCRIHVVEEARHVRFARAKLTEQLERTGPVLLRRHRHLTAVAAYTVATSMIHPRVYEAVGLDSTRARAVARANPHHRETLRWMAAPVVEFLTGAGMMGHPGTGWWRRSGYLG